MKNKKVVFFLIIMLFTSNSIFADSFAEDKDTLRIGIPLDYLDNSIKPRDAKAAFKLWTNYYSESLKKRIEIDLEIKFYLYEKLEELKKDVVNEFLDVVSVGTYEYLTFEGLDNYEIRLSGLRASSKFSNFLIICNKDSELDRIDKLKASDFLVPIDNKNNLMILWLKKSLYEGGIYDYEEFLNGIKLEIEEKEIIYSIFFNKDKTGLVRKDVFEIVSELNPQIKNKIDIMHRSEEHIENVTVFRKSLSNELKKIIFENTIKFHESIKERQLLNLFKVNKLVEIKEKDLSGSIKLLEDIRKLSNYSGKL